jgi:hypothetical protein
MGNEKISLNFLISASCVCLVLSLVFLSISLTGNVIADMSVKSSSQIGSVLFLLGIVGIFSWVKKKRS